MSSIVKFAAAAAFALWAARFASMTDFLEDKIRGYIHRSGTFTQPTTLAAALATGSPTDAGTGASMSEVPNSNNYARVNNAAGSGNWTAASSTDGLTDNTAAITFAAASGSWGTVSHCGLANSTTHGAGDLLYHGALTASKAVGSGDVFQFAAGAFDITFA